MSARSPPGKRVDRSGRAETAAETGRAHTPIHKCEPVRRPTRHGRTHTSSHLQSVGAAGASSISAPDRAVRRHYCAADPWLTTPSICTNLRFSEATAALTLIELVQPTDLSPTEGHADSAQAATKTVFPHSPLLPIAFGRSRIVPLGDGARAPPMGHESDRSKTASHIAVNARVD